MKYRIKIVTYRSGRKRYFPEKKRWGLWLGIFYDGEVSILAIGDDYPTREGALHAIDLNYEGNVKKQTIEFEYINK